MNMQVDYFKMILNGLFVFALLSQALGHPAGEERAADEAKQSDEDYQYDDESIVKPAKAESTDPGVSSTPYFPEKEVVRLAQIGMNVTLECSVKNSTDKNVIIWYKDTNVVTTGKAVSANTEKYAISSTDTNNLSLIVLNTTQSDFGDYYCEVLPQKIRLHTSLKMGEPETTTKAPEYESAPKEVADFVQKAASSASSMLRVSVVLSMLAAAVQYLRI